MVTSRKSNKTKSKKRSIKPKGSGGIFGGGQRSGSAPVTANDSGRSNSYLSVLAGISEGPIQGLINGPESIFLDNTPAYSDGVPNFSGFSAEIRHGYQDQSYLPGYADEVNEELSINTEVKYQQPIVRQIINKNLDTVTVRLALTMQTQDSQGNVNPTDLHYRIWIKEGLNGYRLVHDIFITKKFSTPTEFEYIIPINNGGGTIDRFFLKVERLSPTIMPGDNTVKTVHFAGYVNSSLTKLSYPNTALVGMKFEASQFSAPPQVAFEIRGIIVDVPSNATVWDSGAVTYTGVWDGNFITPSKACSDPAWILWDLLTKRRYGLGKKLNITNLNRWKFLEISKYCNEMVPDGNGGYEHRFLSNFVLESAEDAYKVIETIRSIFHGMSYFLGGAINFSGDFPGIYVAQFTQSDVERGMFSYSRTGLKAVHNVAIVTWIDPSQGYTKQIETVEDYESIITDGYNPTELLAFGATSRGQARRAGLYLLYSEKLDRETVTFKCRSFAANVLPGQLIKIADNKRADIRYGGLIKGFTRIVTNVLDITLDFPVLIIPGENYILSLMCEDGKLYDYTVINDPGNTDVISVVISSEISDPALEGNWILASINTAPQLFRVLNRVAVSGSEGMLYEITALQHNPQKYNIIDFDYKLDPLPQKVKASLVTNPVPSVDITYNVLGVYPNYTFDMFGNWSKPVVNGKVDPFVVSYIVEYREGLNGLWVGSQSVNNNQHEIKGLRSGEYYMRVASVDIYGKSSRWTESQVKFLGINGSISTANSIRSSDFATLVI